MKQHIILKYEEERVEGRVNCMVMVMDLCVCVCVVTQYLYVMSLLEFPSVHSYCLEANFFIFLCGNMCDKVVHCLALLYFSGGKSYCKATSPGTSSQHVSECSAAAVPGVSSWP